MIYLFSFLIKIFNTHYKEIKTFTKYIISNTNSRLTKRRPGKDRKVLIQLSWVSLFIMVLLICYIIYGYLKTIGFITVLAIDMLFS